MFFSETKLFLTQLTGMVGLSIFAFGGTWRLLKLTDWIAPLRVSIQEESEGLDLSQHGEKL